MFKFSVAKMGVAFALVLTYVLVLANCRSGVSSAVGDGERKCYHPPPKVRKHVAHYSYNSYIM